MNQCFLNMAPDKTPADGGVELGKQGLDMELALRQLAAEQQATTCRKVLPQIKSAMGTICPSVSWPE